MENLLLIYSILFFVSLFLMVYFGMLFKRRKLEMKEKIQELRNLNVAKDKFISVMAHDLKTPAANIKSLSNMLKEKFEELSKEDIKTCVEMLVESSKTHSNMIDSLLELSISRLGNKEFVPVRLEISRIINTVLEQTKLQALQKHIKKFNKANECYVTADKNMITAVIRNLVVNAIKFNNPGGKIVIYAEKKNKELIVSIADTGVGIPDSKKERIFRIDGSKSTKGTANETGTGLGLLLCKEYVEQHGGRIWLESEEGKGTTFYFSLPV